MASEAVLNNLSSRPSVVIASSCDLQPSMIVKELLGILPIAAHRQEGWLAYLWKINNIYYEADVNLIVLKRKCLLPVVLRGTVRVVILMFDSYDEDFAIESWHSFLLPYRAFVRMLVCTKIDEDDLRCLPRLQVQHWCILHGFDLVELQSSADEWEEEQGFGDCTGMLRIKEALLGHMWPNLLCNGLLSSSLQKDSSNWHYSVRGLISLSQLLRIIMVRFLDAWDTNLRVRCCSDFLALAFFGGGTITHFW